MAARKENSMSQFIQDVFVIENLQVLTEGKTNPITKVRGIFGRVNETNKNGRKYPTKVMQGQLNQVQPMIEARRLCGELDHPQNDTVKLSNASHLITKLELKGDELIGEAEILNTPAGMTAKALIEGGVCLGISSRGMGTLSEDADGSKVVNDDFKLVTFDLVAEPSTRGAYPGAISESTEGSSTFVEDSINKLTKEQNFVQMIEQKLRDSYTPWIEEKKSSKTVKCADCKSGDCSCPKTKKATARKKPLVGKQTELDKDKDGDIDGKDFAAMRGESVVNPLAQMGAIIAEGMGLISEAVDLDKINSKIKKAKSSAWKQHGANQGGVGSPRTNSANGKTAKTPMEMHSQEGRIRDKMISREKKKNG